ncbi:MAG TPA: hypothetical protein DDW50_08835, partial [Firmicutes bacterium]|nr:hypothetical protein [Bacillota bacterium]
MIHHTKKFCCYAELLQLSDNAIYTWRLDGEIDSWNHGAELLYGFNETEALGHNSHDLLQTCFPCPLREMESVLRQSRHWEGELVEQTKDGRTVTVSTKFLLVYGEDEVERVLEITRDITEHKRMENENRSLTKFLSENPNPILRLSREGVILYTNEASGALLQMWDCVIGDTVPESFYQVVTETFISHLERTVDIECNQRIYSLNIVLIADMGYVNIYGSDITERKRVEKLLRESEAHFRVAVKNSNFVLSQFDRDLRYTWMHNPHPDFDASLMIDRRGEELENSQGMRRLDALKRQVLENGKGVREEIFFDRSDGQHTYDMIIEPIYDGAGAVIGGTSCALDITGHKRAEVALMESKAKLELVFSSMNDALFFVSADGELIDFNDAFVSFYRFKEREECIRTISGYLDYHEEWFPDGTPVPVSMGPVCRALRGESGTAQYKIRKKETGETWWASYSFAPMRDKDGKIVGCVCVARDITQQKQMDEALRISEERFRLALIHSPVNISSQDLNLVYTWQYNPQLGYAVDEVIGKTDPELLPFETARQLMDMKQKAIITGTQVRSEVSIVNQNEILYYDFTIEPLRNQQGDIVGVNNIMVDITERKRTEVVLRRQAEMLNLSYEAMFAWELNGVVISWNQGAQRLYGYSSEEAINSSGHELLKTKFPIELDKIKTMLVQDKTWSGELVHTTKNGGTITVESRLQLIQDDLGRLIVLETNRDTTQRKQALEALYETTNYLENLIDYANAPIIVWNPNFRITRFNHAFERLTGLKAGEVIGKFLDILFPESSIADSSDFIERTSKGEFWETVEIPILRTDGTIRTVLWNSANICEKDGVTVAATIAQGQDITERKYAEAALQVKKEELTTANEELQAQQEELAAANEELQSQTEELNSTYQELQRQTEEIRKQAEATARERDVAEQRAAELDATISSIAAGVIIYDNMGNVIRINDYAHILYKFTSDDYPLPFQECLAGLQMHKSDGVPYATEETPLNRALRGEVIRDEEMMI